MRSRRGSGPCPTTPSRRRPLRQRASLRRRGLPLASAVALAVQATPALAGTVVVGYVTPNVEFGFGADGSDDAVEFGEVRARGVVVNNLEPGIGPADTADQCPSEGCDYQLIVIDPAALRADADPAATVGCASLDYGIVDAAPQHSALGGGARLYTGHGPLPDHTVQPTEDDPTPLTAGVGLLCFANPTHEDGLTNDAGDGPLTATQPSPIVVLHGGDLPAGDLPTGD